MIKSLNLSVALVTHNNGVDAVSALDSILTSTADFLGVQFVVVDNASGDDTPHVLKRWLSANACDYEFIQSTENNIGRARKIAVDSAKHDLIYFTDPDCKVRRNTISLLVDSLLRQRQIDDRSAAVGGANYFVESSRLAMHLNALRSTTLGHFNSAQMLASIECRPIDHVSTCNAVYWRPILNANNFSEEFLRVGEDLQVSYKLIAKKYLLFFNGSAIVDHASPEGYLDWLKKSFGYGKAQMKVASRNLAIYHSHRLIPFYLVTLSLFSLFVSKFLFSCLTIAFVTFGLATTFQLRIRGSRGLNFVDALFVVFGTSLAYGVGEVFGAAKVTAPGISRLTLGHLSRQLFSRA